MVQNCCVLVCKKRKVRGDNIGYHKFPNNHVVKSKWLDAVNRTNKDLKNKNLRVCSRHFFPSDYIFGGNRRKLKATAVPSVNVVLAKEEYINAGSCMNIANTSNDQVLIDDICESELFILRNEKQQLIVDNESLREDIVNKLDKIEKLELQVSILQKEIEYLKQENNRLKEKDQHKEPPFTIKKFEHSA